MSGYSIVKQVADEWSLPIEAITHTDMYRDTITFARREAVVRMRDEGMPWLRIAEILNIRPDTPDANRYNGAYRVFHQKK